MVGTVDYVAPEQIRGDEVDGRADVYSLGCVLFECLTGEVPFPGGSEVATIYAHLEEDPPRPSARCAQVPAALDAVVTRRFGEGSRPALAERRRARSCGAGCAAGERARSANAAGTAARGAGRSRPDGRGRGGRRRAARGAVGRRRPRAGGNRRQRRGGHRPGPRVADRAGSLGCVTVADRLRCGRGLGHQHRRRHGLAHRSEDPYGEPDDPGRQRPGRDRRRRRRRVGGQQPLRDALLDQPEHQSGRQDDPVGQRAVRRVRRRRRRLGGELGRSHDLAHRPAHW